MLFKLLHSNIKVNNYICSDINSDLISLWNTIKDSPEDLIDGYLEMWNKLNEDEDIDRRKNYYYEIRNSFNLNRDPSEFLFLSRTCVNGLIRYNSSGNFNTSLHLTRDGMNPKTLAAIIIDWHNKLNTFDVKFLCRDYSNIQSNAGDLIYLDPPYANSKGMYYGKIDCDDLWNWIREQKGKHILSFDGKRDLLDITYDVPKDIYTSHEYVENGRSSFKDLKDQKVEYVKESLYIK